MYMMKGAQKGSAMPDYNGVTRNQRIAMLIDGDNAEPALLEKMLIETSKYGTVIIRRIYGDWTGSTLNGWKKILINHAFQPMQQFAYTTGKNSTDSALIIDAMDLLHEGIADCFCVVSSDSDYTRLATRIRSSGSQMIGIGRKTTPSPFVAACDIFVYTENLDMKTEKENSRPSPATPKKPVVTPDPLPLLRQAFEITVQENGWTTLASLGHALRQIDSSFDPRTYGMKQLSGLLKAHPKVFEIDDKLTNVRMVKGRAKSSNPK
jgi:hypothetical protein